PLREISPWVPKATVAIEDRRFWQHGGVDYESIFRAAVADIKAGHVVEGGSTITQQLVRNLYRGYHDTTLRRKIREACLAIKLSERWSRRRILATYVNRVFYGEHSYGVQAAAETYFSVRASKLRLDQAALIAGLPQAPSVYDPFLHPSQALQRRNDVLEAMAAAAYITPRQYRIASRRPLGLNPGHL